MKMLKMITLFFAAILVMTGCDDPKTRGECLNTTAALPALFKRSKQPLKVVTSSINKKLGTMATLYGNESALLASRTGLSGTRPNEIFELVTWQQKADEHWFGAKIPGNLKSLEYVTIDAGKSIRYQKYNGANLIPANDTLNVAIRLAYIFKLKASIMP
jgi:hypothetical protein